MASSQHLSGLRPPGSPSSNRSGRPISQTRNSPSAFGSRVPPPVLPIDLPQPGSYGSGHSNSRPRSRSPLRHSHSFDDSNSELDHFTDARSDIRGSSTSSFGTQAVAGPVSAPAVSRLASSFMKAGSSLIQSSLSSAGQPSLRDSSIPNGQFGQGQNQARRPYTPSVASSKMTDAEIEAEALAAKEQSRIEAERILTLEAEERRRVEERVLAMLRPVGAPDQRPTTPPGLSNGFPPGSTTSAPTTPKKEDKGGWMGLMKKLTPTKDLTPAQQIINETKQREKEREKERKREDKEREKERGHEWPSTGKAKLADPSYLGLASSLSSGHSPSTSPSSRLAPTYSSGVHTPSGSPRQVHPIQTGFSPAPETPTRSRTPTHGPPGSSPILATSPGEPAPIYAIFSSNGSLDVHGTLITVTRRFEKLEKWTVDHVRALEERMKDVEKYLMDRESQLEESALLKKEVEALNSDLANVQTLLKDLRGEFAEMKLRPSAPAPAPAPAPKPAAPSYGREPSGDSDKPTSKPLVNGTASHRISAPVFSPSPSPAVPTPPASQRGMPQAPPPRPTSAAANAPVAAVSTASPPVRNGAFSPTTPPATSSVLSNSSSRSRLPYPTGDYTSPSSGLPPTRSRPASPESEGYARRPASVASSYSKAKPTNTGSRPVSVYSQGEPHERIPSSDLAPPKTPTTRGGVPIPISPSTSPTPRKRYTIALSGRDEDGNRTDIPSPNTATRSNDPGQVHTALFSDSPSGSRAHSPSSDEEFDDEDEGFIGAHGHGRDASDVTVLPDRQKSPSPTIGRTAITLSRLSVSPPPVTSNGNSAPIGSTAPLRPRPRSTYGSPSPAGPTNGASNDRTPNFRARAQSTYFSPAPASPSPDRSGDHKPHRRAQSTDRYGALGLRGDNGGVKTNSTTSTILTPSSANFVDPLMARKKEKQMTVSTPGLKTPTGTKIPFGQLVAFFDDKKKP